MGVIQFDANFLHRHEKYHQDHQYLAESILSHMHKNSWGPHNICIQAKHIQAKIQATTPTYKIQQAFQSS